MSLFALVGSGVVMETAAATFPVHPALTWLDISAMSPQPTTGWTYAGGVFTAPPAPVVPLPQQAKVAMSTGMSLTSTGTPALNGVYDVSSNAQAHMQAEMMALLNSGGATFADGTTSISWPDVTGAVHTFTPAQAKAFFLAAGSYVSSLYKVINGISSTMPAASATIS